MSRTAVLLTVLLMYVTATIPLSTTAETNEPRDPPTVKIGFLNPMTGPIAVYAPPWTVTAQKAIDDLNAAGGNFELVMADSGCDYTFAATGAQTLVDAGVVAVAGAACSGASMSANAILSAAGIPMISYGTTAPGLSDATAYPLFFRVVPSDATQGNPLSYVVNESGMSNPALLHMNNDYGSGLADSFEDAWVDSGGTLCTKIGYADSGTDFTSQVQQVMDGSCDSVMLISYASDGAAIIGHLADQSFSGQIFGGDGIAEEGLCNSISDPSLCDGIVVTKWSSANITNASIAFDSWCANNATCAGGIYVNEAYDAVRLIGEGYLLSQNIDISLSVSIFVTGNQWEGASGVITFRSNGDTVGHGFDICEFSYSSNQGVISLNCNETWYGPSPPDYFDSDDDGIPDSFDSCPDDPGGWADTDNDGICNYADDDDDGDGHLDVNDDCPLDANEYIDTDGDGYCDVQDTDDDNDGTYDLNDAFPLDPNETADWDGDGIGDNADLDDDNDGWIDSSDDFPFDSNEWLDTDGDGTGNNADTDDDGDGYSDADETTNCGEGNDPLDSADMPTDTDGDLSCNALDSDDDNDWVMDEIDSCPLGQTNWASNPTSDYDGDGCRDYDEDIDDDNDGINDEDDAFPLDPCVSSDYDSDGLSDLLHYVEDCQTSVLLDLDHDNDLVLDTDDFCWYGDLNWTSGAVLGTDHDGDGCRDDGEDTDDDGDGVDDSEDQCPRGHTGWLSNPVNDIDGDGCHETEDYDRDGDGFNDVEDAFPEDPEEWSDSDGDGVGDNGDAYPNDPSRWEIGDDDGDGDPDGGDFTILLLVGTIICLIIALVVVLKRK